MRVLLVTSPNARCGIREYGEMLVEAMRQVHPSVEIVSVGPDADMVVAYASSTSTRPLIDLVHVNHHQALHASWTADHIVKIREVGVPVVVTHHDTFEHIDILRERDYAFFVGVADHVVVHEPVYGPAGYHSGRWTYLRQPVPPRGPAWVADIFKVFTVGSVGFDFPWKGFDRLRKAAARIGWETSIFGGVDWVPRAPAITRLTGCHATAFLHQTGNSGTSGAIRLGFAARRPVIAQKGCRQFRDLELDPDRRAQILWVESDDDIVRCLMALEDPAERRFWAGATTAIAEADSWARGADVYYRIYEKVREQAYRALDRGNVP